MTKLLIAAATALGIAFAGMPAMAASTSPTGAYQVAQASTDAPTKGKKTKKKGATKKAEGGEKAKKKAKGKKKDAAKT